MRLQCINHNKFFGILINIMINHYILLCHYGIINLNVIIHSFGFKKICFSKDIHFLLIILMTSIAK